MWDGEGECPGVPPLAHFDSHLPASKYSRCGYPSSGLCARFAAVGVDKEGFNGGFRLVQAEVPFHLCKLLRRAGFAELGFWRRPSTNGSSMPQRQILGAVGGGFEACRSMPQRAKIFTWRTFFFHNMSKL